MSKSSSNSQSNLQSNLRSNSSTFQNLKQNQQQNQQRIVDSKIFFPACKDAFKKLDPRVQLKNPVMFVTEIGALLTSVLLFTHSGPKSFEIQITLWLWFTVLFANFAEALAEGRGKAQAESLRKSKTSILARLLKANVESSVQASTLRKGDVVVCETNDTIPNDGEVIEGIASVDESAITGESAPVIRESGGDRSAVTGGTRVISDRILIRITADPGDSFIDRMISLVEGAKRQKTPNEIALSVVLSGLTIIFVLAVSTLKFFTDYSGHAAHQELSGIVSVPVLVALLVCLIPTTIGGLLSAIGISGMDRLIRRNVIATSGRSVEAAGDIDVLLLDKTGTITLGNRMATEFLPVRGVTPDRLAAAAQMSSLADETPEGRSVVILAKEKFQLRADGVHPGSSTFIPFSAHTRMSGVDVKQSLSREGQNQIEGPDQNQDQNQTQTQSQTQNQNANPGPIRMIRKGAADSVKSHILQLGGRIPDDLDSIVESISKLGGTPLAVSDGSDILGVIYLKDIVKGGINERFAELRRMGIRTVMITGDNPLTAAAIAAEAGVDDFMAQATPESKLQRIRDEQRKGHLVAMTGDGTNDAPALAQADVGVAMNTGTQAAREAGNMVDLDSNPTKLIEIVEIGKQLLMTRGSLTTFSIANDVAKYFAILPAIFSTVYLAQQLPGAASGSVSVGGLGIGAGAGIGASAVAGIGASAVAGPLASFNLMGLVSPQSAILSAVIFNALVIIALIPLALRGVPYRAASAADVLRRNLLIYGLGGLLVPFIGIKLIDMIVNALGWV